MNKVKKISAPSSQGLFTVYQHCRLCSPGFVDEACYSYYLLRLRYRFSNYGVLIHAFSLLPDRLYLLVTAPAASSISRLLASVNDSYSNYFCSRFRRSGKVWSARPTLTPVRGAQLSLEFQVLIERMAISALGLGHPGRHRWSSYCSNAFVAGGGWLERSWALRQLVPTVSASATYRDVVMRRFDADREGWLLSTLHGSSLGQGPACRRAQHWRLVQAGAIDGRSGKGRGPARQ